MRYGYGFGGRGGGGTLDSDHAIVEAFLFYFLKKLFR